MITTRINSKVSLVMGGVIAAVAGLAWAKNSDDGLVIDEPVETDVYAAHRTVDVNAPIEGDLVAAGGRVTVDGNVAGDIIVAGRDVEIQTAVSDDVRAAGRNIRITAPVSGHVIAAGQSVSIEQDVSDWAWLAGDSVEVLGNIGSDLKIRAAKIKIDAEVDGNIELIGDELDLGPNSVVRGDLRWRSRNDAEISPDAQIEGEFIEEPPPGLVEELGPGGKYSLPLNSILAVTVLFLLFSRSLRLSADRIATRPGMSVLIGFVVFCAMPILAVLLFFSGIAVWLGFAVLLTWVVLLLLGVLTGLFAASDLVLRRFREQPALWQSLAAIFVTVVVVALLTRIPWAGFILVVAILMLGVGALCWNSWSTLRNREHREIQ